ncbi:MAG: lactonase family protein [Gemmataceae bacterium]|nr:lactonase family protein [Gemmataceae bacterium]
MLRLLSLIALMFAFAFAQADTFLYVSMAPEKTIRIYKLDPADGSLTKVDDVELAGAPGSLAVDPAKKLLFASVRSNSSLASFSIDRATGKLKSINTVPLGMNENAAFVAVDPTGKYLLSASYAAGKVAVHRLKDGTIEEPAVQTIKTVMTSHAVVFDPTGKFAFVPHVAPNAIYQYRWDAEAGKLAEAGKAEGGTPKAGPRHLAFHPSLKMAFSSNEVANSITAYRFDADKGLTPLETKSTLPETWQGKNTTAEVKVHPNGRFVWVSNRGHNSLAGFGIDAKTGVLTPLEPTKTEPTPRSFEFDSEGKYLFAAGEGSGKIATYRIEANGRLELLRTTEVGKSVTWVMAVKF